MIPLERTEGLDRETVTAAWQAFIEGSPIPLRDVRPVIHDSWLRCKNAGVQPRTQVAPFVGEAELSARLATHVELVEATRHTWQLLKDSILPSQSILVLTDTSGVVLEVHGNGEMVASARARAVAPGFDWNETRAGTNAIGTALATDAPAIVHTSEHYCSGAKIWDCAAAIIRDLHDGSPVGVLDITSLGGLSGAHTLAFAVTAAKQIEHTLHSMELARSVQLLNWYRSHQSRWRQGFNLLLDRRGRVITMSDAAHEALGGQSVSFRIAGRVPVPEQDDLLVVDHLDPYSAATPAHRTPADLWPGGVATVAVRHRPAKLAQQEVTRERHPAFDPITTRDNQLLNLMHQARRMALSSAPVLVTGETGTGKELFAQAIHRCSAVANGPFVAVNCGTLTRDLAVSELLGYEAGAFTGASSKGRSGKFEEADGGTLFLDEIGELSLDVQVHLLRVLQDNVVIRLGGNRERYVRVRIIAATNRDLRAESEAGAFRSDLYFRLKVLNLALPPLRARPDDLDLLTDKFLSRLQREYGLGSRLLTPELREVLTRYQWPGNVRELHGLLERMYILSNQPVLGIDDLPEDFVRPPHSVAESAHARNPANLRDRERHSILEALADSAGNLSKAAAALGISRSTLYRKLKQYGIPF